jgi:hypothetical protein
MSEPRECMSRAADSSADLAFRRFRAFAEYLEIFRLSKLRRCTRCWRHPSTRPYRGNARIRRSTPSGAQLRCADPAESPRRQRHARNHRRRAHRAAVKRLPRRALAPARSRPGTRVARRRRYLALAITARRPRDATRTPVWRARIRYRWLVATGRRCDVALTATVCTLQVTLDDAGRGDYESL